MTRAACSLPRSRGCWGRSGSPRSSAPRQERSTPVRSTTCRPSARSRIGRCCSRARQFAESLRTVPGVEVLNDVVLNQVLVRFTRGGEDGEEDDAYTLAVIAHVQDSGVCWMGGTTWDGRAAMRISVSNWRTTENDV